MKKIYNNMYLQKSIFNTGKQQCPILENIPVSIGAHSGTVFNGGKRYRFSIVVYGIHNNSG